MTTAELTPEQVAVQEARAERARKLEVAAEAAALHCPSVMEIFLYKSSPEYQKSYPGWNPERKKAIQHFIEYAVGELAEKLRVEKKRADLQIDGLDAQAFDDATEVAAQGRAIAESKIPYVLQDVIPDYGMLGMNVAYAKVGKTTLLYAIANAAGKGGLFIGRRTKKTKVLIIAAEDPPEYTAWVARHLDAPPGMITFYRSSILLDDNGLGAIVALVKRGGYGLVIISSWQSVIRGLVRDENDNAGSVLVVERVKQAARETGVPWIIDAHSGKGEDQKDDANPIMALRGASSAAGAADFMLSLRYADGPFSNKRRFSGMGRFVMFPPQTIAYDAGTGTFELIGDSKNVVADETWNVIWRMGAINSTPRTVNAIAKAAGFGKGDKVSGNDQRRVKEALKRDGVVQSVGPDGKLRFQVSDDLLKDLAPLVPPLGGSEAPKL